MNVMPKANLQLLYVSDIEASTEFYSKLFNTKPLFTSPRYVAFSADSSSEALFAIWTGGTIPDKSTPRYSEVGIMLPSNDDVDALYQAWKDKPFIKVIQEPIMDVFGRTFLIEDPDGHVVRICPVD